MLNNIGPITKNILILNVIMFILKLFLETKGIYLGAMLGAHYFGTALFQPYQIVSHFFMHADFFHILTNMFVLVMFGSFLERLWGPKRYLSFYLVSALGAFLLYNGVGFFQLQELKQAIGNNYAIAEINLSLKEFGALSNAQLFEILDKYHMINDVVDGIGYPNAKGDLLIEYYNKSFVPMVGASGAIFGIMAAFALLFPNTELMLLFPPIPIKAKYLIGGYFVFEVYSSFYNSSGDHIAHLAHVGGAVVGGLLVLYWRRKGKNFW
jgi:membrane associated rhomboid family serine protease